MELERKAVRYWQIIRWDATGFLTENDTYCSRLYRDKIEPALMRDVILGLRGILGGMVRFLQGFVESFRSRTPTERVTQHPYALLVVMGTEKYASEEREMIEAFEKRAVAVRTIHVSRSPDDPPAGKQLSISSSLMPGDQVRAFLSWSWRVLRGMRWCGSYDRKQRSLFASAIPAIRDHSLCTVFARRIVASYGRPLLVLSQAPWATVSIATTEYMKSQGIVTAAIRTQTTSASIEHVVINSDILFCKSPMERHAYEEIFAGKGPRLLDGCLLSLPEPSELEPLQLPVEFVLVLGTAPSYDQEDEDYAQFSDKLFKVATAARLSIVFKGHDLARDLDEAWFAGGQVNERDCLHVYDIRRNRELIDRASLVVSAPSTLLYHAILREKPVILVETNINAAVPDEFETAPILRFAWDQEVSADRVDWDSLRRSSHSAKSWFAENYHLGKGPDYMVGLLLKEADDVVAVHVTGTVGAT